VSQLIRVLVVDDSAFVRKVVTQMLSRSPLIEVVGIARDGSEALEKAAELKPDVITLDLIMPGVDGVEFLRQQMALQPIPVVVCSIAHESGEMAIAAFDAGAVEFVQKPTALATDRVFEIAEELIAKVKAAAQVQMGRVTHKRTAPTPHPANPNVADRTDCLVIGVSTGGPQALRELIPALPKDFPVPIGLVLHMPVGYTELYARRLNEISSVEVHEARDGDLVRPGVVLLAPAGKHLTFVRRGDDTVRAQLDLRPFDTPHRPSVDVLFRSAADVYGSRTLGVVMTGMGDDGLLGAGHIKAQGGRILTEAESSCVVYGMPRVVAEAALSDRAVPLDQLAAALMEML
jgi:two-component system, chemotaxis family, protein-glutamate methylesterase/glutaminase